MRLAILDDDAALGDYVARLMMNSGHQVQAFKDAKSMLKALRQDSFDLLLLDWVLPDSSGLDVLRWVGENLDPAPPTIMITVRGGEADIVSGLTAGADDYVVKPLRDSVLKARVEALLRRVYGSRSRGPIERFGRHVFDLHRRAVTIDGTTIATTAKEFALALLLFRNLSRPLSRNYILEAVWGSSRDTESRTLDAHISQIRSRLGLRPENGLRLSSVYGFGYRLEEIEGAPAQFGAESE